MTKLEEITKRQYGYISTHGGIGNIREADDTYNEMNREQIEAFKEQYGAAYLGKINYYGEDREAVAAGNMNVYVEYTGQMVYNFDCSFCVPAADERLAEMIKNWNRPSSADNGIVDYAKGAAAITKRIEQMGGLNLIWF